MSQRKKRKLSFSILILGLALVPFVLGFLISGINIQSTKAPASVPASVELETESVANTSVITFKADASEEEKNKYLESINAKIISENKELNSVTINLPSREGMNSDISEERGVLLDSSIIAASEPDYFVTMLEATNDPEYLKQWYLPVLDLPKLNVADEKDNVVAVVDSGACFDHPDLQNKFVEGFDFVQQDNLPQDENGHGCAVSGVIAANVNNTTGISGLSSKNQIMPLRVLDKDGIGTYSNVAAAIVWAVNNKADVINLSLGGANSSTILESAINFAKDHNVKVVAAAGNTSSDQIFYPAAYDSVVAVGSLDSNLDKSSFSSFGSGVDAWAPGRDIFSTKLDGSYGYFSGTSFAAPMVSGGGDADEIIKNETVKNEDIGTLESPSEVSTQATSTKILVSPPCDLSDSYNRNHYIDDYGSSNHAVDIQDQYCNSTAVKAAISGNISVDIMPSFFCSNLNKTVTDQTRITITSPAGNVKVVYMHNNSDYTSTINDGYVNAGEAIATVGNRGCSTGAHIHFEVYQNNTKLSYSQWDFGNKTFDNGIAIYIDKDYSGLGYLLTPATTNPELQYIPDWIDGKISSIKIGKNLCSYGFDLPVDDLVTPKDLGDEVYWSNAQLPWVWMSSGSNFSNLANMQWNVSAKSLDNSLSSILTSKPCVQVQGSELMSQAVCFNGPGGISGPNPPNTSSCPAGQNGLYCGGTDLVGGQAGVLYNCQNGVYTVSQTCSAGCIQMPQGTADKCAPEGTDYCKTIPWGGAGTYCKGDQLVTCSAQKTTVNNVTCAYGCQQNALFTPDTCKTSPDSTTVNRDTVKFYANSEYGSESLRLQLGAGKSNEPFSGTQYKSMSVPSGWSIKTYSQENQQGESRCWKESQPFLETEGWYNKIESVEIFTTDVCGSSAPEAPYWRAYYYDGDSKWWDRDIPSNTARCTEKVEGDLLSINFGNATPCGGGANPDNWVGEFMATRYFPEGDYVFKIKSDDGMQMFINGQQKAIRSSQGDGVICPEYHLNGNVDLKFILREDSGDAGIDVSWSTDLSGCKDITPPGGKMISPVRNLHTNSSSTILLKADAYDQVGTGQNTAGVSKVEFYAKSNVWNNNQLTLVGTSTTVPYEYNWDTTSFPEGIYFLTAKIFDAEGNDSGFLGDENFWTNVTVDRTKPTADILPVAIGSGYKFNVSWEGEDNLSANNELNFDVQYKVDCTGEWIDWVGFRSGTVKTFSGLPGQAYCFRARAIDLANNVGDWSTESNKVTLPTCGENELTAEYFDNKDLQGEPVGIQCESWIDHNWVYGGTGFSSASKAFGDGGDGPLVINGTVIDNPVDSTVNGTTGTKVLTASNANFRAGQKVLIYQVKGTNAGTYQINTIHAYDHASSTMSLKENLNATYATGGNNAAQIIVIKQYTDVTITAGSVFKAKDWDGQTGGVLIFFANGQTDIQGTIDATGAGYRGGRSGANPNPFADNTGGERGEGPSGSMARTTQRDVGSGGGGVPRDPNGEGNGGGGGGLGSAGQSGGRHISTSGAVGDGGSVMGNPEMSQLFFGGAGGGGGFGDAESTQINDYGNGGDGGGIIFISSKNLAVNSGTGKVTSGGVKGQAGILDIGAGGSGAGGSVFMKSEVVDIGPGKIFTLGIGESAGGTSGGEGRSGNGRVHVEYYNTLAGASTPDAHTQKLSNGEDHFSVRWTGKLELSPNRYKFKSYQDDGFRLWINGEQIIDDWTDGYTENAADKYVSTIADIKGEYYENGGAAHVRVEVIPFSNQAPVIDAIPDQITSVSSEFADLDLNLYGYDPDFNFVAWSVNDSTNVHVSIDSSNIAKITKTAGWSGEEVLTFTLTDEWGESTTKEVKFKVVQNNPPVITSSPVLSVNENTNYVYQVAATDPENETLTYSLKTAPEGMVISGSGNITWSPTTADIGNHNVTVEVSDGVNNVQQNFVIEVKDVFVAPDVTQIPGQTVIQGNQFAAINLNDYVSDADVGDVITWVVSGNTDLQVAIVNNIVTITYPANWSGQEVLNFKATDSHGLSDEVSATFKVEAPNECANGTFKAEYFDNRTLNGTPKLSDCVGNINYDWGLRGPRPGIGNNNFSIRWTGFINFDASEYQFITQSDDGIRLWVDGQLLINHWNDHAVQTDRANINLTAGVHKVIVEYYERGGLAVAKLNYRKIERCTTVPTGNFCGEYFNNRNLNGAPEFIQTTPNINKDWGRGGPGNGVDDNNFSVRWIGKFTFEAKDYEFTSTSDDGFRLWIDNNLVINNWNDHARSVDRKIVSMSAGEHTIKVEYYERGGQAIAKLDWRIVPKCDTPSNSFCVEYFNNRNLSGAAVKTATENSINHNWGGGSPTSGVDNNNFSIRWQGKFTFTAGQYRFSETSDDGVRVWVDGQLIVDDWNDHAARTRNRTINLTAGEHVVKMEYYERGGQAVAKLSWVKL